MSLNSPDYEDDDLDTPTTGPLNEDDILWGVERTASNFENRWVERSVREATDEAEAIAFVKEHCRWWGGFSSHGDVEGKRAGIWVRREGREGVIPWFELIQRIRGTYVAPKPDDEQISLF